MRSVRRTIGAAVFAVAALGCVAAVAAVGATRGGGGAKEAAHAPAQRSTSVQGGTLEQAFERVVRSVSPSVVQIQTQTGLGSGVIFDRDGNVVTNAHVVGTAKSFTVTFASGRQAQATLVGRYVPNDLAVVHVDATGTRAATFADSSRLAVGQIALALGNPLGFRSSVTQGIVSALGRSVQEPGGGAIARAIQTSAAINPGNSGGALVDLRGRVIGIPTLAATDPQLGSQAPGIGFAIPSNTVRDIAEQLIRNGRVLASHRAYLGVMVGDTQGGGGVYVGVVAAAGPAARAGIRVGDVILSVAGRPTPTANDLGSAVASLRVGQTVAVVLRGQGGGRRTVHVTLGQYPVGR